MPAQRHRVASGRERIRIVHCVPEMNVGGREGQLTELICRLPSDRFEQLLVVFQRDGALVERVRSAGCRVVELGYEQPHSRIDPRFHLELLRTVARYWRQLRAFEPDVLHAQLFWGNLLSVAAGRLAGVPAIVTSRLRLRRGRHARRWMRLADDVANRFTTVLFANSEAVRRDVLAHERIDPDIIRVIPNGVNLTRLRGVDAEGQRRELGLSDGDLVLIAVANLHPYKGHGDLLRALAQLRPAFPNLRLLLPGRDEGEGARLSALIEELGLTGHVHLLGERRDVPALLSLADVAVHPSHQEGFSNSVLEAMGAGCPMVVTDVGGNPEAVRDGVDGFVVPSRDPAALAGAMEKLLRDPALRARMGESARRRIEEQFSLERMIERFTALYESLAASRAGNGRRPDPCL